MHKWGGQRRDPVIVFAQTGASVVMSARTLGSFTAQQGCLARTSFQTTPYTQHWASTDVTSTSNSEISAASWLGLNLYPVSIFLSLNAYRRNGIYNQKP